MRTLIPRPCPKCGQMKLHKTDYNEMTCISCWISFEIVKTEESRVPKWMIRQLKEKVVARG